MSDTAREIFPFMRLDRDKSVTGERAVVMGGTFNPDGSPAGSGTVNLAAVPDPTDEELAAIEDGTAPEPEIPTATPDPVIETPAVETSDLAAPTVRESTRAEGNSSGAPSKA